MATRIRISQGVPGPPGTAAAHAPTHAKAGSDPLTIETLATIGAVGSVPTSDGVGGVSMAVPSGSGNVISPGGETAGRVTKFTGANTVAETATTETELATAVTHSAIVTGNPHSLDATDVGAEAAGAIATHAADGDAHHSEAHTLASHSDVATTGPNLDAHIASTANPHAVTAAQAGAEPSGSIATHAALANAHHAEAHTLASHSDVATTGAALDAHLASSSNPHTVTAAQAGAEPAGAIATHASDGDAHHAEAHTVASHSDTTATGAELDELTDGSETTLHSHAGGGGGGDFFADGSVPMTDDLDVGGNDVVNFIETAGAGSSGSLKDFISSALSAGRNEGGEITVASGTEVSVAMGSGGLRALVNPLDALRSIGWPVSPTNFIPLGDVIYIGVEWNGGTPQVFNQPTDTWNYLTNFPLGSAVRDSTGIHISNTPQTVGDSPGLVARRFYETAVGARDVRLGGLLIGETGTRNITMSLGALWIRTNKIPIAALDTSVSGSVDFYFRDGASGFNVNTGLTQWPNVQIDDDSGVLQTLTNGRYANLWFYLGFDGDVVARYPVAEFTQLSAATEESAPATSPIRISAHTRLIARLTFQEGSVTAEQIDSVFDLVLNATTVNDHAQLSNVLPDQHHAEAHTLASHSDVTTTGAALDAHLASTSNPHSVTAAQASAEPLGAIATHAGLPNAHHAEAHTVASHSDTTATGAELEELTDGSETTLHSHAGGGLHAASHSDGGADEVTVENLATAGAVGSVPTSDGAGGLTMSVPGGGGDVTAPGSETAGRITKFTGSKTIAETATTETELATAVTHSGIVTGNPHALDATDVGAEAAGAIATHAALGDVHHAEAHTVASHSDTTATGAELETLTDGSNADALHTHAGVGLHAASHQDGGADEISVVGLSGLLSDPQTPAAHTIASHSDTTATGTELETLTDGSNADALHAHAAAAPAAHMSTHANGGSDELSVADLSGLLADPQTPAAHTIASHSDTTATGTELETLTDGSNADTLHVHSAPAHTIASHTDTTATGAELDELTDGSETTLHSHAGGGAVDRDFFEDTGGDTSTSTGPTIRMSESAALLTGTYEIGWSGDVSGSETTNEHVARFIFDRSGGDEKIRASKVDTGPSTFTGMIEVTLTAATFAFEFEIESTGGSGDAILGNTNMWYRLLP